MDLLLLSLENSLRIILGSKSKLFQKIEAQQKVMYSYEKVFEVQTKLTEGLHYVNM